MISKSDLETLGVAFGGEPHVYIAADSSINTDGLGVAYAGEPFSQAAPAGLASTTYDYSGSGGLTIAGSATTSAKLKKLRGKGPPASGNNAAITPGLPADVQVGDLMLVSVYSRMTSGSLAVTSGWTEAINSIDSSGALAVWYRFYQAGDTAPTITPTGGSNGDTIIGQVGAWWGIASSLPLIRDLGVSDNTSQQNIGPITGDASTSAVAGGDVVIVVGGKASDWTSVANITNFARLGATASALGNKAGLVWDYTVPSSAEAVSDKTFVVTGGSSAVGKGVQLIFDGITTAYDYDVAGAVLIAGAANTSISPVPHTTPASSGGGGGQLRRKRPGHVPSTIAPERQPIIEATLEAVLDGVALEASAEVGVKEIARSKRLAAIAALIT